MKKKQFVKWVKTVMPNLLGYIAMVTPFHFFLNTFFRVLKIKSRPMVKYKYSFIQFINLF